MDKKVPFGKVYERRIFGECPWNHLENEHFTFFDCVQVIINTARRLGLSKSNYTKDVSDMEDCLAQHLGCNKDQLEFFTAIGSPMDSFHGVDGFFIWWKNKEKTFGKIVTFDLTSKLCKTKFNANYLITRWTRINPKMREVAIFLRSKRSKLYHHKF